MREPRQIPQHMTAGTIPRLAPDRGPGSGWSPGVKIGPSLTGEMVRYLQAALDGWSAAERELQLGQLDQRLARVYRLWSDGSDTEWIAEVLGVSRRRAQQLVKAALAFMAGSRQEQPDDEEDRLVALAVHDRAAFVATLLSCYGWRQAQIAHMTGTPLRTVQRRVAKGRAFLGAIDSRTLGRFSGLRIGQAAVLSPDEVTQLVRENARDPDPGHDAQTCAPAFAYQTGPDA